MVGARQERGGACPSSHRNGSTSAGCSTTTSRPGRADKPALLGEFGALTFADVARLTARTAALLARARRRPRAPRDDGARRLARLPRDVPRGDPASAPCRSPSTRWTAPTTTPTTSTTATRRYSSSRRRCSTRSSRRWRAAPRCTVLVANGDPRGHTSFDDAVASQPDELTAPPTPTPDDMAFWLYSSGSTGRPKGVVHTPSRHRRDDRHLRAPRAQDHRGRPLLLDDQALPRLRARQRPLVPAVGRRHHGARARARPSRTASSRPSRATPPRCSSPSPPCTRRCSRRPALAEDRLLEHPRLHLGGRAALRRGVGALAGADRRADPRRDRLDRDAAHLLLQHARGPAARAPRARPYPATTCA